MKKSRRSTKKTKRSESTVNDGGLDIVYESSESGTESEESEDEGLTEKEVEERGQRCSGKAASTTTVH